jgi:membrane protease YdiL (CAAX protease family)
MTWWFLNVRQNLSDWHRSTLEHAGAIRRSRTLPLWIVLGAATLDFCLVAVWFRCTRELTIGAWAISDVILYLTRFAVVTVTLAWGCGHYRVSREGVGIRPSHLFSDLRWSIKCCLLGASVIGAAIATGFAAACWLGFRPPAPPVLIVELLGSHHRSARHIITLGGVGVTGVLLAPVTEELIYRSLLLPALTHRLGLYTAIAVTAVVFGLVHVIPFGELGIPALQILGGLMMAAAFSIRWSVTPAIVLHGLGNTFVGILCFTYVRLYETCPLLFLAQ